LTASTISSPQLSLSGKDQWWKNQCENDADGTLDHHERPKITGIEPGKYAVRLANKPGRCASFAISILKPMRYFQSKKRN
jgi:hypothetical protein